MIPSSRADPKRKPPDMQSYQISVQRKNPSNNRWSEIASWLVQTTEDDMSGPLNCGLKQNYRIVINTVDGERATPAPEEG